MIQFVFVVSELVAESGEQDGSFYIQPFLIFINYLERFTSANQSKKISRQIKAGFFSCHITVEFFSRQIKADFSERIFLIEMANIYISFHYLFESII